MEFVLGEESIIRKGKNQQWKANYILKIGVIQIQPILNIHLIEEELSLLLEIYKEEDK
ncbi:MAG: hypothetical protein ACI94Y_001769 [Maribacter sp.]|jgi:hypothetical protein